MRELEYPFDSDFILNKKKRLRRELLEQSQGFISKKIAILGGSTTNDLKLVLELFLLNQGIKPVFYESEYNQYFEDAVFGNKELNEFQPDVVYVCTSVRNILQYPDITMSEPVVEQMLRNEAEKYKKIWDSLENRFHCPIIQNNFEYPSYRLLGNKDRVNRHGAVSYIDELNKEMVLYARNHNDFFVCDLNYIAADYGLKNWFDEGVWYLYKYAFSLSAIPDVAFQVANIIKSIFGKNKKGLILDLDNTLWGGVIGDDGPEGIELGPETGKGQAYQEFQTYLKSLKDLGLILNIDSKNDYDNAILGLEHTDSVLKKDDFTVIKANWEPKNQNFIQIAEQLNLLPESLVFIDDNPAERMIVTEQIPGVSVPEMDSVENYRKIIDRCGFFEVTYLSEDDLKRNEMYRENAQREASRASFENYEAYLHSLEMKADISGFKPVYMERISQLTNKSNQFNLTTLRLTREEIEEKAQNPSVITLYGKLLDRFGDNGVVSVVIGELLEGGKICDITLWLMSCRVLKRDMEFAMMDSLVQECIRRNVKIIRGRYLKTAKNAMVKDFYGQMGFTKKSETEQGDSEWEYQIPDVYIKKNKVIQVEE